MSIETSFAVFTGGLYEEWEDGPETKNIHELVTTVRSLRPSESVVQDSDGSITGQFLFSQHEVHELQSFALKEEVPVCWEK